MKNIVSFLALTSLVVVIDLVTKLGAATYFITSAWAPFSWFELNYGENHGIAFGIPLGRWVQVAASVLLLVVLGAYVIRKLDFNQVSVRIFLALIFGGAFGNLVDRIWLGVVRDFIGIGPWPLFNLADIAIVTGVLLFLFYSYRLSHE